MAPDPTEPAAPQGTPDTTAPNQAPKTPVDGEAQEEAGKVREQSGGYD